MNKKRILIVDDDRLVLSSLERGLTRAGYDVITECDAQAARARCRDEVLDLAILDVRLPDSSGVELAAWLREQTQIPFVILSAHSDRELIDSAAGEGALGYLVKPVELPQILAAIEAALARAAEIRTLRRSEAGLSVALEGDRNISIAVGVLMERHRLGRDQAFEVLRSRARAGRCKLTKIAADIVAAADLLRLPDG